ncbi:MAG: threonine/serine dehydratase [Thermoleophilia bacterium]|nr:threonine/serine dehydratase [Thermoleophilia bacterium]
MTAVTREDVLRAAATIAGRVRRTPLLDGSAVVPGLRVKAELLQETGSFKVRGVVNRLDALTPEERARGVVGVSAGNHAMALAWASRRAGIDCVVVMFGGASPFKIARTKGYGAAVEQVAGGGAEAFARMEEIVLESGRVMVHPFDDPLVIAGQGTVGLEILADAPDVDVIAVPAGGGGLVAGIAAACAGRGVRVVAVEPEGSDAVAQALAAGVPIRIVPQTIAGGLDGPFAGVHVLAACEAHGVEAVTVADREIEEAMRRVYADLKLACEPAGAAAVAAVLAGKVGGERPVAVLSGGNVAADVAAAILRGR